MSGVSPELKTVTAEGLDRVTSTIARFDAMNDDEARAALLEALKQFAGRLTAPAKKSLSATSAYAQRMTQDAFRDHGGRERYVWPLDLSQALEEKKRRRR